MVTRAPRRLFVPAVVALALGLIGCGGDGDSPTSPAWPPDVAGRYFLRWTLQVLRKSDGFQKEFVCQGRMTLVQGSGSARAAATLSGFFTVGLDCGLESYALSGSVDATGAIEFTADGPRPPEGPCPGGRNVRFSGQVTSSGTSVIVSARGVTTVTCPQFGEHQFAYLISATR